MRTGSAAVAFALDDAALIGRVRAVADEAADALEHTVAAGRRASENVEFRSGRRERFGELELRDPHAFASNLAEATTYFERANGSLRALAGDPQLGEVLERAARPHVMGAFRQLAADTAAASDEVTRRAELADRIASETSVPMTREVTAEKATIYRYTQDHHPQRLRGELATSDIRTPQTPAPSDDVLSAFDEVVGQINVAAKKVRGGPGYVSTKKVTPRVYHEESDAGTRIAALARDFEKRTRDLDAQLNMAVVDAGRLHDNASRETQMHGLRQAAQAAEERAQMALRQSATAWKTDAS